MRSIEPYLFMTGLFLLTIPVFAQKQTKVDSLINQMEMATDTIKVDLLDDIAVELQYNDPYRALDFAKRGLQLAEALDYQKGIANLYNDIGVIYGIQGRLL